MDQAELQNIAKQIFSTMPTMFHAVKRMAREENFGLAPNQLKILKFLQVNSAKPNMIAKMLQVSAPTVSGAIETLVQKGLVHRVPSTTDRRVINLHLTQAGGDLLESAENKMMIAVSKKLGVLSDEKLVEIAESIRLLEKVFRKPGSSGSELENECIN